MNIGPTQESVVTVHKSLRRGERRVRIALVGLPGSGKSTIFRAVESTAPQSGALTGTALPYQACSVQIGMEEASVVDLPGLSSLLHTHDQAPTVLQHLLWGNQRAPVAAHETSAPPAPFEPPDVIVQVLDATNLQSQLELTLELSLLGRPVVLALNHMDVARAKGIRVDAQALSTQLGMRVVSTVAVMGQGIAELFEAAMAAAASGLAPPPQTPSAHIGQSLQPVDGTLAQGDIYKAFGVPPGLLLLLLASGHRYFVSELQAHFPGRMEEFYANRSLAQSYLPRDLDEEIHADRHHRAATLCERVLRREPARPMHDWRFWLDELMLHPHWGLLGSVMVFALVLWVVFQGSGWIDLHTTQPLVIATQGWQPTSTMGVVLHAVLDGFVGLVGIVVPYMIPLVLLLIALEEAGLMHRIAFVVDRGFHKIGLHGGVAVPFLLGLGCNVPAISAAARGSTGRERLIASVLITFVPCSARSAIILAIAGKYLGVAGVVGIYALTLVLIAGLGRLMSRHQHGPVGPGQLQTIPPYALPRWGNMLRETWVRTQDILTIVTPLLVGGSVVLALLGHVGADRAINTALTPLTLWWLGLPVALGLPLLFGVLRKELSLLMIFQALGTQDMGAVLSTAQIATLLVFLSFYVPCISTFAVMHKTLGSREAWWSVGVSAAAALLLATLVRLGFWLA